MSVFCVRKKYHFFFRWFKFYNPNANTKNPIRKRESLINLRCLLIKWKLIWAILLHLIIYRSKYTQTIYINVLFTVNFCSANSSSIKMGHTHTHILCWKRVNALYVEYQPIKFNRFCTSSTLFSLAEHWHIISGFLFASHSFLIFLTPSYGG